MNIQPSPSCGLVDYADDHEAIVEACRCRIYDLRFIMGDSRYSNNADRPILESRIDRLSRLMDEHGGT